MNTFYRVFTTGDFNVTPSKHGKLRNQMKRAKWHLGIRSQSRPRDIMLEVNYFIEISNVNLWNSVCR